MKRNDMIVDWVVKKIKKDYKDDVSLLLTYGSYENGTANPLSDVDFYFIPKTKNAYTCLQNELNEASIENGLYKFNLMDAYNAKHLEKFKERAVELQKKFVKIIEENGVNIEKYDTVESFINNN
ncbi:nucleotidyltransferase domain-containing protein [Clostridium hydrogenum]|uniref:nucleotidyltransferase domain-containing protein n=1 Tax=Clostridium hydrogenum TaxID=2855764 RepID=UPI001F42ECBF|nr:nucleotidyltransferase domain-containing protein [Clostridium hydrogenum]